MLEHFASKHVLGSNEDGCRFGAEKCGNGMYDEKQD
jgi:hypothetical protein